MRKDLFESSINKRLYHEKYKCELRIPETFEEFNQIASFFSKSNNADSPTEYGAGITLGNVGVASSEFLSRFFEKSRNLYDRKDNLLDRL